MFDRVRFKHKSKTATNQKEWIKDAGNTSNTQCLSQGGKTLFTDDASKFITAQIDATSHITKGNALVGSLIDWETTYCEAVLILLIPTAKQCSLHCKLKPKQ